MRPASTPARPSVRLRRFGRNRDGATAVEFALVAAPFFALVFAIIETALVFFAGQVLETGLSEASRMVRTGQAQQQGLDEAAFRQQVCSRVAGLFDCEGGIRLDVRVVENFGNIDLSKPIDDDGNLVDDFGFNPGTGGDIVIVRAFYEWPTFVPLLGNDLGDLANGNRLLAAAATFRNEPF